MIITYLMIVVASRSNYNDKRARPGRLGAAGLPRVQLRLLPRPAGGEGDPSEKGLSGLSQNNNFRERSRRKHKQQ